MKRTLTLISEGENGHDICSLFGHRVDGFQTNLRAAEVTADSSARLEVAAPRSFGIAAMIAMNAYGLLLVIPVVASIIALTLTAFSLTSLLLPMLAVIGSSFFLPAGLGNAHVKRLVSQLLPASEQGRFIVQLTLDPRARTGFRSVIEDADDVGWLSFTGSALQFRGDSIQLDLPFKNVQKVVPQNIGLRGLFVYGPRVRLHVSGLSNVTSVEIAERSSLILPTSRRLTRELQSCCEVSAASQS